MALHRRQREQLRALCGELHEDDGVDPRRYFRPARQRDQDHRKSRQLCRQVQRTLDLVLTGETRDELLASLKVVSVLPGRDASQLLVTVTADVPPDQFRREQIEAQLALVQGRLRSEIAAAITRKKTPVLTFQILAPDAGVEVNGEDER
ncbi:ribosome-binding factor A [Caulifigura coniformis]|uniref:Ribosome-binding factor A n=1 Tax=Caulifigura coniformis TaxID=2527983 RepID=A0A517SGV9_9PLAN|nr:ribosome-binding factor A [Caulifigura coniformis]QDT55363.1 ribosome-binding factor A [Caulifigura coniformis]